MASVSAGSAKLLLKLVELMGRTPDLVNAIHLGS
jgi:hypothetical protein